ncbi:MAG: hypothetical protein ACYCSS_06880 [Sulfuriferula sp.]
MLFIKVESQKKGAAALVPLAMFRSRGFLRAVTATVGMTFSMYGVLFLLPLAWQSSGILDPLGVGLALIPMALVFVLVLPFSGALSHRIGNHFMTSAGVAIIGLGLLTLSASAGEKSIITAEIGLMLTGLGMELTTGPLAGCRRWRSSSRPIRNRCCTNQRSPDGWRHNRSSGIRRGICHRAELLTIKIKPAA